MAQSHDLAQLKKQLSLLSGRTPHSQSSEHFCELSKLDDAGVYLSWFSGSSEWERHPAGDELVMVIEGAVSMWLLDPDEERHELNAGGIIVVPQGRWHRFEAIEPVYLMTVTKAPTEHDPKIEADPQV